MNNNMNQENWRMWKRGKQWVFASALIIAVMGASGSPVIASASERQLAEVTSNEKSGHQTPPPIDEQETTYTGVTVMDGIQYKMLPNKSAECEIIARMPEAGKAPVLRGTVTFDGIEHKVVSMREDALVGSAEIIEMDQDFATQLLANPSAFQPSDVSMTKKVKLVLDQDISAAQASILTNHIVKQQSNHSILFTSKSETPKYTGPKEVSVVKGESVELNMDVAQYAYYHNEGTSDWLNEEHAGWVKPNGEKVTGSLLNIENAKSEDAGVYTYEGFDFFYFQNQYWEFSESKSDLASVTVDVQGSDSDSISLSESLSEEGSSSEHESDSLSASESLSESLSEEGSSSESSHPSDSEENSESLSSSEHQSDLNSQADSMSNSAFEEGLHSTSISNSDYTSDMTSNIESEHQSLSDHNSEFLESESISESLSESVSESNSIASSESNSEWNSEYDSNYESTSNSLSDSHSQSDTNVTPPSNGHKPGGY